MATDQLDRAIAAAANPEPEPASKMATVRVRVAPTGREIVLQLPVDITELELLSTIRAVLDVGDQLRAKRPTSRLVLPGTIS